MKVVCSLCLRCGCIWDICYLRVSMAAVPSLSVVITFQLTLGLVTYISFSRSLGFTLSLFYIFLLYRDCAPFRIEEWFELNWGSKLEFNRGELKWDEIHITALSMIFLIIDLFYFMFSIWITQNHVIIWGIQKLLNYLYFYIRFIFNKLSSIFFIIVQTNLFSECSNLFLAIFNFIKWSENNVV